MSHNPNPNADTSGFSYPSAAGKPTNTDQNYVANVAPSDSSVTESSSTVPMGQTYTMPTNRLGPAVDLHHGKLGDEHGGAGTRADDRKGDTISPTAQHHQS